ncbi:unnamed protein product [Arctia plantaginis]|uniref:Uncharacterized protein n=1 Tax=Arctia plantaginis TaxID=874455 RepID=A0A8S1AI53_ARCPL|nr:unnamed protein product [Arctia plantaginis]CAB3244643.1 unnamed protein product [Arctia plantaginis]
MKPDHNEQEDDASILETLKAEHEILNTSSDSDFEYAESELDNTLEPKELEQAKEELELIPRYGLTNLCFASCPEFFEDPTSVRESLKSPDKEKWVEAMQEERKAFKENNAWSPVSELPLDKTLVQYKWVIKRKINTDNRVNFRPRLEAEDFMQRPGIDLFFVYLLKNNSDAIIL